MTTTFSDRRLGRATLARQMLLERHDLDPVEAVGRLGGLQAQEPRPPFVALWTRLSSAPRDRLLAALEARVVVRATAMRATLHLLGAADFRALRPTLAPALDAALRGIGARAASLDLPRIAAVARDLLGSRSMTFNELRPLLAEAFPDQDERALGYAARTQVPLVMVPSDDPWGFPRDPVFTLAEGWVDGPLEPPDASGLVRRHLGAFGPASAADVQAWSGLKGLAKVIERMGDQLVELRDERGRVLHDLPEAPRPPEDAPAPPRLLPEFDSVLLAHADRRRIVSDEHRPRITTRNLRVPATILVDGVIAGSWTVARRRAVATLTLRPFARLPAAAAEALAAEAEDLLRFTEPDSRPAVELAHPD